MECAVARAAARYAQKSEAIKAAVLASYRADPEPKRRKVRERRALHPDKVKAEKHREYERHSDVYKARAREWELANPERKKELAAAWRRRHPNKLIHMLRMRVAALLGRRPKWLTRDQKREIARFYQEAAALQRSTGIAHHVDHIVPLRGETVSGLHVPWNLQVIPAAMNRAKSNRFAEQANPP